MKKLATKAIEAPGTEALMVAAVATPESDCFGKYYDPSEKECRECELATGCETAAAASVPVLSSIEKENAKRAAKAAKAEARKAEDKAKAAAKVGPCAPVAEVDAELPPLSVEELAKELQRQVGEPAAEIVMPAVKARKASKAPKEVKVSSPPVVPPEGYRMPVQGERYLSMDGKDYKDGLYKMHHIKRWIETGNPFKVGQDVHLCFELLKAGEISINEAFDKLTNTSASWASKAEKTRRMQIGFTLRGAAFFKIAYVSKTVGREKFFTIIDYKRA